jgi:hypothetical protein
MNSNDSCTLSVRVMPGSRKDGLIRTEEGWKVQVAAPPVEGQANERLIGFLSREVLGLPKRSVRVKVGASGRNKLLEIDASASEVEAAMVAWLESP